MFLIFFFPHTILTLHTTLIYLKRTILYTFDVTHTMMIRIGQICHVIQALQVVTAHQGPVRPEGLLLLGQP
jgi:hypothetical protein